MAQDTNITSGRDGFTLVEAVIIITIITIISYLVLSALPIARTNQLVKNDVQRLQSLLTQAQQRAFNEIRDDECLARAGSSSSEQKLCSNVGVAFGEGALVLFADFDDNKQYSDTGDFLISESTFSSSVDGAGVVSVLFAADPPVILTYVDGGLLSAEATRAFTIYNGSIERSFTVGSYGILETINE